MKKVIMQNCGKVQTQEEFYDWKAGQEAIKDVTGFEYAFYDPCTQEIKGFYLLEAEKLVRGQRFVYS